MKNPLFAIISCHKFSGRRESQRKTWIPRINGQADYKFFLGNQEKCYVGQRDGSVKEIINEPKEDEVFLDVADDYTSLPAKVKAVMQWALDNGYEYVLKIDDDVYIYPELVLDGYKNYTYIGHPNGWVAPAHPKGYMSGFAYWLSPPAVRAVAEGVLDRKVPHEDRWVGGVLFKAGLNKDGGHIDDRYIVVCTHQKPFWKQFTRRGAAFAQFEPGDMEYFHDLCMNREEPSDVTPSPRLDRPTESRVTPIKGRIFRLGKLTGY